MARHGHHPASHAARKGVKGSPHTKGMPSDYLSGHGEDSLNAHHSHVGHISKSHENLSRHLNGSEPRSHMDEGPGCATQDEDHDV